MKGEPVDSLTVKKEKEEERAAASQAFRAARSQRRLRANFGRHAHVSVPTHCGVYFIQCGEWVKIGWSVNIEGRFEDLERLNPARLIPLGFESLPGGRAPGRERELHEYFALEHHRGEWFRFSDELRRHIAQHASPWPER